MKILIIPMLILISSVAIAEPSMMELYRDRSGHHFFSDERYLRQYSPAQRQGLIDQRNAEIAHRYNAEMAKQTAHANEMQQYYASERASMQFIDDTRRYNAPPTPAMPSIPLIPQQQGQYYSAGDYYGNGGLRFTPSQIQGFIDQNNIDRAREKQAIQEQYEADYERWRQAQNARRDTERFIGK